MLKTLLLSGALALSMTGAALAQANLIGSYKVTGTNTDGSAYEEGSLTISQEPSGAYLVKWDGGDYIGIGQVSGNIFAIATVVDQRNSIMLMTLSPDGSAKGQWWRRSDAGTKGTEVWTKK